jgi:hypothetical protein
MTGLPTLSLSGAKPALVAAKNPGIYNAAYRCYCACTGSYTRGTADFYAAIESAGFVRRRDKTGRFVDGLRLKNTTISDVADDFSDFLS